MTLHHLLPRLSIHRFEPHETPPPEVWQSRILSITRTDEELSIVCEHHLLEGHQPSNGPWACFKVQGPLDFSLTGVLLSLTQPLVQAGISLFALSTYDTDYILVREEQCEQAAKVLQDAGHVITIEKA